MRSQFVTASSEKRNKSHLPYAFTEHGVTMLASVLRSDKAVKMSIEVVRAFIALKQYAIEQNNIAVQFQEIRDRLGEHDVQLNAIYDAIPSPYCAATLRGGAGSNRRMIVVLPEIKLRGSWLSTRLIASYSSGSSCLNCTVFSKNSSTATAQNSW
ncbi:MAG: ORF6N domain-containing protein [Chitinophagaceae bacterium]|nr:ORF6N domain-containing protein [Chitinophagaceae bacterium]